MRQPDLWACDDCGTTRRCDPLASDDWSGEPVAVGPDCPECGGEMRPAEGKNDAVT